MDSEVGVLSEVNTYKLRLANAEALKEITDLSIAMKDPLKRTPDLEYRI